LKRWAEGVVSFRQGCTLHPAVVVNIGLMRGKAKKTDDE
jgi:hypothetical protein